MNDILNEIKSAQEAVKNARTLWHMATPEMHDATLYALRSAELRLDALYAEAKRVNESPCEMKSGNDMHMSDYRANHKR